ncbi:MAG: hypothetical protein DRP42_05765, partial [Tenericutes bacterium]
LIGGTLAAGQGAADKFTGARQNFIAGVEQLISREFLDSLISVKAQGATFGALQKAEQDALTNAASKIGTWRMTTGKGDDMRVTGYNTSEKNMVTELNIIKDIAKVAFERAGGEATGLTEEEYVEALLGGQSPFNPLGQ